MAGRFIVNFERYMEGDLMQSRTMLLVEAVGNVVVGYGVAVATQMIVFPWFGLHVSVDQNLAMD